MKYLKSLKERIFENQMHDLATKHGVEIKDEDVEKLSYKLKDKEGEEAEQEFKTHFNISDKEEQEETTEEVTDENEQQEIVEEEPIEESILSNKGSMVKGNAKTLVQKYDGKSVDVSTIAKEAYDLIPEIDDKEKRKEIATKIAVAAKDMGLKTID